jgi:hypothetical protein
MLLQWCAQGVWTSANERRSERNPSYVKAPRMTLTEQLERAKDSLRFQERRHQQYEILYAELWTRGQVADASIARVRALLRGRKVLKVREVREAIGRPKKVSPSGTPRRYTEPLEFDGKTANAGGTL